MTFQRLLKMHKRIYKDINDNCRLKAFDDADFVIHRDILFDLKFLTIAQVHSSRLDEAKKSLEELKKVANVILNQGD